ncbi:MAG: M13 family metallopeptidase [Betaproteobacteria bacterium]|nr:M13 family metallopeptidase [Betaproteobacteria bacterium]
MIEVSMTNVAPAGATPQSTRCALLLAALLSVAAMPITQAQVAAVPAASEATSTQEADVDASVKPGDDFFAYANGAWLKATEIPAGQQRWGARSEITELTRRQVLKLLDDASLAAPGSIARKVADFRAAWLNEGAIEAKGIAPIKHALDRIDRIRDKAQLARLLGSNLRADVDPMNVGVFRSSQPLGLAAQVSIHGEKTYVAFLVQGGLGLADRDNYLGREADRQALRERYRDAVGSVLALLGAKAATTSRAEAVLALETALAQSHATVEASGNELNADNVWNRADFARQAPGLNWSAYFAAAGLDKQPTFVAWQPGAVTSFAALVAAQPLQTWKDYLRVRLIAEYADLLPRAYATHAPALRGLPAGQPEVPRAQRATEATESAMGDAIGRLYVERHFPPAQKARVQAIVANVTSAFTRRISAVSWMSPDSKAIAIAKLRALYAGVAYPETWQDYSDLTVAATDPVGNLQRIAERQYRQTVARLGKPVNRSDWCIAPQFVGGVLLFQQHSYYLTAALLQVPKFDADASDAAAYGAIGAIYGHEMSHFVDLLGAEYEVDGRRRRWWTAEDTGKFAAANEPLVKQFSAYQPFADLAVNGKATLSENIADLGGLAAAFDAYRTMLGSRVNDKEYLRRQDRQFFIGFARSWRSKFSVEALRKYVATNDHAPDNYRIATVRNIDAWYEAFDVQPGQHLYLEPATRVRVW